MKLLYNELNEKFIPRRRPQMQYTHESAVVWDLIQKYLFSMIPSTPNKTPTPQQLCVHFCFEGTEVIASLSDGREEKVNLTLQGVTDTIPRAEIEGLMVEYNSSNDENDIKVFSFTFTPSNFGSTGFSSTSNEINNPFSFIDESI